MHKNLHPFFWLLIGLYLAALGLHFMQNNLVQLGGQVAFVKVLWLVSAVYLWFLLPVFFLRALFIPPVLKRWIRLFWYFMLARGVIELYMMYVTVNWHPHYGIAHDALSVLLLTAAMVNTRSLKYSPFRTIWYGLSAIIFTLVAEIGFAWYMLHNVTSSEPVYYVPDNNEHAPIFLASWVMVVFVLLGVFLLARKWPTMASK